MSCVPWYLPVETPRRKLHFRRIRYVSSDLEEIRLERIKKPDWAVDFGRDRYGAFGDLQIPSATSDKAVCQCLRHFKTRSRGLAASPSIRASASQRRG